MIKLKSFLITRLILVIGLILACEVLATFLSQRFILPFAAGIAHYTGQNSRFNLFDAANMLTGLFTGNSEQVMLGLLSKSAIISLLTLASLLFILPVFLGILWYSSAILSRIDQIQKAREEERAAYEAERNLMMSDFAHDLRTPIMTIGGYAGALADGVVPEDKKQEYLEAIRRKSGQMSELINLLFDYTKLGSAHFNLQFQETDLNELLRTSAAAVYDEIDAAGMDLLVEIPETAYIVQADAAQVSRIARNLLTNAIKHNPSGTRIAIGVKEFPGLEQIAFADTGVPIEKDPAQLFEPFVKGDDSRSESKGSGLGLSIAKKIADAHSWTLEFVQPFGNYTKAFVLSVPERSLPS